MKILVGNKSDLKDQLQVSEAEGRQLAEKLGAIYMLTSAKVIVGEATLSLPLSARKVDQFASALSIFFHCC